MAKTDKPKLTNRQAAFVREYLCDLNATQAAIRAGYSEKTAKAQGSRLLTNADIAEAIQKAMDERAERVESEADWVLRTIKETTQALLSDPEKNASNIFKGSELLGKHHKLFTDKVETTGANGGPVENLWRVEIVRPGEKK